MGYKGTNTGTLWEYLGYVYFISDKVAPSIIIESSKVSDGDASQDVVNAFVGRTLLQGLFH